MTVPNPCVGEPTAWVILADVLVAVAPADEMSIKIN